MGQLPEELRQAVESHRGFLEVDAGDSTYVVMSMSVFREMMGVTALATDKLIQKSYALLGLISFLTAGPKEVRTWIHRKGGTAVEAAGNIHTYMARGFIRAEVMTCADLVRLGGEREVKAEHLVRQEPKDYAVQDDDIILMKFSV